ncbi:uncharacterized protein LOC134838468 [Culicoides brevitarsis]|uniref:uncharacterized protein LOC134838468 n=1 Tax=Culicoides brevitarsis TaxID=469753 RepID=UPI00307B9E82
MASDKSEYSSDEQNPPEWLNNTFFEQALAEYLSDTAICVTKVDFRPGTKAGDHYGSCMFRAKVTFDTRKSTCDVINLIIKTLPVDDGAKLELLRECTAFKTEMKMYGEVLPEMHRLLRTINDDTKICPTIVYQSNEPAPILMFIDEGPNGFKSFEKALNLEQTKVLCDRIAKFHACSVYMNENGVDLTTMDDCPYKKVEGKMNFLSFFITKNIKSAVNSVKKWKSVDDILEVMEKNVAVFDERIESLFRSQDKLPYQILIHGDFGFKNMMYRNDGTKSEDFLLIDYQFCYWNTPAMDVLALLYMCANFEARKSHREAIIQEYFIIFIDTLTKLDYKGRFPELSDLQTEIKRCGLLEYMFLMVFVPFEYVDFTKLNMNEMMENQDLHGISKHAFENADFQEMLVNRVRYLIEIGAFD